MKPPFLQDILKGVSRSFYLTLRVLPPRVRPQIGIAYLFCRAADTIADTEMIPLVKRVGILGIFREQFKTHRVSFEAIEEIRRAAAGNQKDSEETRLIENLPGCFKTYLGFSREDQDRIRHLVSVLTKGMEMDLKRFSLEAHGALVALKDENDLDQYCYHVAGAVGEFWTRMAIAHFPSMKHWNEDEMCRAGTRFGKGLQMTNILKDLSKDLSRGRCYLPLTILEKHGLKPDDLVSSLAAERVRPLLSPFINLTIEHLEEGWQYIMKIPRGEFRLRLACLWPHLFAVKTLDEISRSPSLLEPAFTIKIPRSSVYKTMLQTGLFYFSNGTLTHYYESLKRRLFIAAGTA